MTDIQFCYLLIGVISIAGFFLIRSEFKKDSVQAKRSREQLRKGPTSREIYQQLIKNHEDACRAKEIRNEDESPLP